MNGIAVNLSENRVLVGGFERDVKAQKSAGTRNQDAHILLRLAIYKLNVQPLNGHWNW
jgi:hypothetical protein